MDFSPKSGPDSIRGIKSLEFSHKWQCTAHRSEHIDCAALVADRNDAPIPLARIDRLDVIAGNSRIAPQRSIDKVSSIKHGFQ
jgi:hypothetical protein